MTPLATGPLASGKTPQQDDEPRPSAAVVDVRDFAAQGDGITDDTAAIRAAIDRIAKIGAEVGVVRFPASRQPYLSREITLTGADRQIVFEGDGVRASRIRITGTTNGYGVAFTARDNSWAGLRNLRIETSVPLASVVYIREPHNAFVLEKVFVHGAGAATYGVHVDGGSALTIDWIYTTGMTGCNFLLKNQNKDAAIVLQGGNHDVARSGFLSVQSIHPGPLVLLLGGRLEGCAGKDLFQFGTAAPATFRVYGALFTAGAPRSVISVLSGAAPRWTMDGTFTQQPGTVVLSSSPASHRADGGLLVNGTTGVEIDDGGWSGGHLQLGRHHLWIDARGRLRVKDGPPSRDDDGSVVGGESCGSGPK